MRFTNPAGLALAALVIPILVLHVLRPRRPSIAVSSTWLWQEVARPVSAASPWQRLRPSLLLLLQLLAVLLLALAVARPVRVTAAPLAAHTIFIIDTSGSMAATDGSPDRLSSALASARSLRGQLPAGGVASIVLAGPQPRVVLSASPDRRAFDDALRPVRATAAAADFATALTLAASLETPGVPVGFVLLSDGGLTAAEKRALLPGTRYLRVGDRASNRGIARLVVEPAAEGLRALVSVKHHGGPATTQTLRLDVDGRTEASIRLRLDRGATVERQVALPAGDRVEAFLEGDDLLAADDHAFAVAGRRPAVKVLVAGPPNTFLDLLLAALPGVSVERSPTSRPAGGFDLAIYDRVEVPADPGAPALAIAPPGGAPGVTVRGELTAPAVALLASEDPLLRDLDLSTVAIGTAQKVEAPGDEVLVGAEGGPLLLRGTRQGRPFVYLAFALGDSDLPLNVAFPVLGDRLVEALASVAIPPSDLRVGQSLPVPPGGSVRRPGGAVDDAGTGAGVVATRPGFHVIEQPGRPARTVAVNAAAGESDIAPAGSLPVPEPAGGDGRRTAAGEIGLLPWVLGVLLVVLGAEWLVSRRRIGVPRRQWMAAAVVRGVIVVCLAAALLGLALPRPGRGVATVFLVDASDSMGGAGREAALDWVKQALDDQPAGARAGVALFGGDARLELTVQERARLVQPATQVDASRTNLAGALRLAAAVLPSDARRRIVVVSDGRATEGDARAEAARLRADGIQVDVHAVDRATGTDVAVVRVEAPARAAETDDVPLRVTVQASRPGAARVTVRRDDAVVDERVVDLPAGETTLEFVQPAGRSGVARFDVTVKAQGDSVPQNDKGHAAVEVTGRDRILVVEGMTAEGATLAEALRASGLDVDVAGAPALPGLDRLAGYQATVLVDVDARALSDAQFDALTAATRDLGRGLLVVGGDRAYALGGYRESRLEELLPVISDITDPKRRPSVAEVLAIDTSGSMGACHCAEGANGLATGGNSGDRGGINKTDISRAGAARAIAALSANDLVGVVAFNNDQKAVIPLTKVPSEDVVDKGLSRLKPEGETDINAGLTRAAEEIRDAKTKLRHIILFTDGFTAPGNLERLAEQAGELAAEGITVSVLATGEGAATELAKVAEAGKGRFYPGRDLSQIPEILQQEAVLASRNFVNEGTFYPKITDATEATATLGASPPLLGYVATTAKPSATTSLRIGDDDDPLLASWIAGLGRVSAWTSDASARWSAQWATWDGYVGFWSAAVRETFSAGDVATSLRADADGERLRLTLEGATTWPEGATATATVSGPDFDGRSVTLDRTSGTTFAADVDATAAGTYAVGARVAGPAGALAAASTVVTQSYSAEYRPGDTDERGLVELSTRTGGRGAIEAEEAFDPAGLSAGRGRISLQGWLLALAALLWPIDVALRRLNLRGATEWRAVARRVVPRARLPKRSKAPGVAPPSPDHSPAPTPDPTEPPPAAPPPTLGRLLDRTRADREGGRQG